MVRENPILDAIRMKEEYEKLKKKVETYKDKDSQYVKFYPYEYKLEEFVDRLGPPVKVKKKFVDRLGPSVKVKKKKPIEKAPTFANPQIINDNLILHYLIPVRIIYHLGLAENFEIEDSKTHLVVQDQTGKTVLVQGGSLEGYAEMKAQWLDSGLENLCFVLKISQFKGQHYKKSIHKIIGKAS